MPTDITLTTGGSKSLSSISSDAFHNLYLYCLTMSTSSAAINGSGATTNLCQINVILTRSAEFDHVVINLTNIIESIIVRIIHLAVSSRFAEEHFVLSHFITSNMLTSAHTIYISCTVYTHLLSAVLLRPVEYFAGVADIRPLATAWQLQWCEKRIMDNLKCFKKINKDYAWLYRWNSTALSWIWIVCHCTQ